MWLDYWNVISIYHSISLYPPPKLVTTEFEMVWLVNFAVKYVANCVWCDEVGGRVKKATECCRFQLTTPLPSAGKALAGTWLMLSASSSQRDCLREVRKQNQITPAVLLSIPARIFKLQRLVPLWPTAPLTPAADVFLCNAYMNHLQTAGEQSGTAKELLVWTS